MQAECRREMMKTYVLANNPFMFEEIYYNISYPEEPILPTEHPLTHHNYSNNVQPDISNQITNLSLNVDNNTSMSIVDLVKTNLNPQANEFIPKKFLDTKQ